MFKFLRYYALASGVVMLVSLATAVFLYHRNEVEELVGQGERDNLILAQSLANAAWPGGGDASPENGETLSRAAQAAASGLPILAAA
ncbi:MAG: hypothetical protein K2Q10_08135, partial [Rhodospirillales bacterium]|nr:hypothetical protein [Rhodospirillales bacterium]